MKRIAVYLRAVVSDVYFLRVCMFIWGSCFAAFGAFAVISWKPVEVYEWFGVGLLLLLGLLGAFLVAVAILGSTDEVGRAVQLMHEGGDIPGVLFVVVVALLAVPITALLQVFLGRRRR